MAVSRLHHCVVGVAGVPVRLAISAKINLSLEARRLYTLRRSASSSMPTP